MKNFSNTRFLSCKNVIPNFLASLVLKPFISLRLNHFFEEAWVNRGYDVDEELTRGPFLSLKLVMQVTLDLVVFLDLLNQVIHAQFTIEWKHDIIDLVTLEASLLTTQELANEQAINIIVLVQIAFTKDE